MKKLLGLALVLSVIAAQSSWSVTRYQSTDYKTNGVSLSLTDPTGAIYEPGEEIRLTYQTDTDAYVVIFDIDTEGYVNLLYPRDTENFQKSIGGQQYALPVDPSERLIVGGERGLEFIFAVSVSDFKRIDKKQLRYLAENETRRNDKGRVAGDPFLAVNKVANKLIKGITKSDVSLAYTYFYIKEAVDFPRYLCKDCGKNGVDPYGPNMPKWVATAAFDQSDRLTFPLAAAFDMEYDEYEATRARAYVSYYPSWGYGYSYPSWYYYPYGYGYYYPYRSGFYFSIGFSWGYWHNYCYPHYYYATPYYYGYHYRGYYYPYNNYGYAHYRNGNKYRYKNSLHYASNYTGYKSRSDVRYRSSGQYAKTKGLKPSFRTAQDRRSLKTGADVSRSLKAKQKSYGDRRSVGNVSQRGSQKSRDRGFRTLGNKGSRSPEPRIIRSTRTNRTRDLDKRGTGKRPSRKIDQRSTRKQQPAVRPNPKSRSSRSQYDRTRSSQRRSHDIRTNSTSRTRTYTRSQSTYKSRPTQNRSRSSFQNRSSNRSRSAYAPRSSQPRSRSMQRSTPPRSSRPSARSGSRSRSSGKRR